MTRRMCCILACLTIGLCLSGGSSADDTTQSSRFEAVGVYIDPHGKPLAAYQCELVAQQGDVTLVGIQGGDHPAFSQPPYYDPHALLNHRIILAALSTAANLPAAKTRVATLMVRVTGSTEPQFSARLQVAASADAKPIDADIITSGVNP